MRRLISLFKDENGATVIEYALIGILISIVAMSAMIVIGANLTNTFSTVAQNLSAGVR